MALIEFKSNARIAEEKQKKDDDLLAIEEKERERLDTSLLGHMRRAFDDAKRERIYVETQILKNMRQFLAEYDPDKIASIREFGGSEAFYAYTMIKLRNSQAWISDVIGDKPFDLEPTPVPSLPENAEENIVNNFVDQIIEKAMMGAEQTGQQLNPDLLQEQIQQALPEIKTSIKRAIMEYAKRKASEMKEQIHDQLVEGDWYACIDDLLLDIFMQCGIMRGPFIAVEKQRKVSVDEEGKPTIVYHDEKICKFERRPPLDMYPGPGVRNFQEGYFIDRFRYTPTQIQGFIGLPGFDEEEIRAVLDECKDGKPGNMREWTTIDVERAEVEGQNATMIWNWEEIDCLVFHGPIQGKTLHEYSEALKKKAPDEVKYYDCEVYWIWNHIICARINPDPLGNRNYYKCSFIDLPDSFWGIGMPQVLSDIVMAINACLRALHNNVGMASGPQVTIDETALSDFEKGDMTPWKRWWIKNRESVRGTIKPIEFYQPTLIAQQLIDTIKFLMALADELTIPAFTHGNPQAGGAGSTASGFSMFQTASSRGMKLVLKNLDRQIIEKSIQAQFNWNMDRKRFSGLVGDMKVVAKGLRSLIAKEQQGQRLTDLLSTTANPIDSQIMGVAGRAKLLDKVFQAHEIPSEEILDEIEEIIRRVGMNPPPTATPSKSTPTNEAGDKTQGKDFQTVQGRGGPPAAPPQ